MAVEGDRADLVPLSDAERHALLANPHDVDVPASRVTKNLQMLSVVLFLVVIIAGVVLILADHWRKGTVAVGGGMIWLGLIRWWVDSRILGVFAVRSRKFDSVFCILVGVLLLFVSISVDPLDS
ncbi:DUF3017 domain-containing protein [Corynebacterium terpenotabidum]|uniref:DUF3017 domain-containing protein n=1 Tax=Corynebacterium terpenotabidum Y-11 TaxID=1200352 RepID=S4XEB4_9CORY|nr:DUF3017 domain-containing protein [Corynebacterium terpenotabidum]AGP31472.1 hypothetical protein A606_09155 [Corynebacterium terpenotabidum Y-11]